MTRRNSSQSLRSTGGLYTHHGLLSPDIRLPQFEGRLRSRLGWAKNLSDGFGDPYALRRDGGGESTMAPWQRSMASWSPA